MSSGSKIAVRDRVVRAGTGAAVLIGGNASLDDERYVERPGPGLAPTAFRIWRAGANPSDAGDDIFSRESAELLMAEQERRGNDYGIDFGHKSLKTDAVAGSERAAGWHRLDVRLDDDGEPELWAVGVEWCADVREGLESKPPQWRYFSPAFRQDDDGMVVSYINTAVTINPATWANTRLATRDVTGDAGERTDDMAMTDAERQTLALLSALRADMEDTEITDEAKTAAKTVYDAHGGDDEYSRLSAMAADEDTAGGDAEEAARAAETDAAGDGDGKDKDKAAEEAARAADAAGDSDGKDKAAEAARSRAARSPQDQAFAALAEAQRATNAKFVEMEKRETARSIEALMRTRRDIPEALGAQIRGIGTVAGVKAFIDAYPKASPTPARATATRGAGQGAAAVALPSGALSVDDQVARAMKLPSKTTAPLGFGKVVNGKAIFNAGTPSQFRAQLRAQRLAGNTNTGAAAAQKDG